MFQSVNNKPGHLWQGLAAPITTGLYPEPTAASLVRDPLWIHGQKVLHHQCGQGYSDCPLSCPSHALGCVCSYTCAWLCLGEDNRVTQPETKATCIPWAGEPLFTSPKDAIEMRGLSCPRWLRSPLCQRNTEAGSTDPKVHRSRMSLDKDLFKPWLTWETDFGS